MPEAFSAISGWPIYTHLCATMFKTAWTNCSDIRCRSICTEFHKNRSSGNIQKACVVISVFFCWSTCHSWCIMRSHEYPWCITNAHHGSWYSWCIMSTHDAYDALWCIMSDDASWAPTMHQEYSWCIMGLTNFMHCVLMIHHELMMHDEHSWGVCTHHASGVRNQTLLDIGRRKW